MTIKPISQEVLKQAFASISLEANKLKATHWFSYFNYRDPIMWLPINNDSWLFAPPSIKLLDEDIVLSLKIFITCDSFGNYVKTQIIFNVDK